jgi:hypothetical protein
VKEAARLLLEEFTSKEFTVDFKPAWEEWRKARWRRDGSIYEAMAAFLRALSEGQSQ